MEQETPGISIYLVGMMGSGKSYWSAKLGRHLHLPAYDLDHLIEEKANKTIREIFASDGEAAFREMESSMLQHIPSPTFVLATGGGTPCYHNNMQFMKTNGVVIWLNPPIDELVARLVKGVEHRPVLKGIADPVQLTLHLEKLLSERNSWYSLADIIINDKTPDLMTLVNEITRLKKQ